MNPLIEIKHTAAQARSRRKTDLLTFAVAAIIAWGLSTCTYIYFYPHLIYNALEKAIVQHGLGATTSEGASSGIPVNTLYAI
jgi:hypothetical protein